MSRYQRGPAWLSAYRSTVPAVQAEANRAARLVDRYARRGRPVPAGVAAGYRRSLSALIEAHHHDGDVAIRAARFAIDALDSNRDAYRCPQCEGEMHDKHDDDYHAAVCADCCSVCDVVVAA